MKNNKQIWSLVFPQTKREMFLFISENAEAQ